MQRRNVVIAVGALVVLGLGGFGAGRLLLAKPTANATLVAKPSTCDDAFRVLKLAPSMITAARPVASRNGPGTASPRSASRCSRRACV